MAGLSLLAASWCGYFILLAGARQSMSGVLLAVIVYIVWALRKGGLLASRVMFLAGVVLFLAVSVYQVAPNLIIRDDESDVTASFNPFESRAEFWLMGIEQIQSAPFVGVGFERTILAHNLFLSLMVDQGIVGLLFFLGYLAFAGAMVYRALSDPVLNEYSHWRVAFACCFIFAMIHSQVAGSSVRTAHLYWPIAMLWMLEEASQRATMSVPQMVINRYLPTRFVAARRSGA